MIGTKLDSMVIIIPNSRCPLWYHQFCDDSWDIITPTYTIFRSTDVWDWSPIALIFLMITIFSCFCLTTKGARSSTCIKGSRKSPLAGFFCLCRAPLTFYDFIPFYSNNKFESISSNYTLRNTHSIPIPQPWNGFQIDASGHSLIFISNYCL